MSKRQGPPKHQNRYAWKPKAGVKINETEVGGRFKPFSEVTGVCPRCREQIEWKRRYGKYKPLNEPAKCQGCSKRNIRQAYHNLCPGCAKEKKVCAKCQCRVDQIVGRDLSEIEAEQRTLDEAIRTARERDKRALLRALTKGNNSSSSTKTLTNNEDKVAGLFPGSSLEDYAAKNGGAKVERNVQDSYDSEDEGEENDHKETDDDRDEEEGKENEDE